MAKKRGKKVVKPKHIRHTKHKAVSKAEADKSTAKPADSRPLNQTLHELEILAEDKKSEDKVIENKEDAIERKETSIIKEEKKLEKETEDVEKLEKQIKRDTGSKPLTKLGMQDVNRGIIGAFVGVVAHFAFIYGKQIAQSISITRATVLIVFSYVMIILLMYETGYREIKEKKLLNILPRRATVVFLTSIIVVFVIFFLFNQINFSDLIGLYKQIAVTSVLASLGAGTADLIGRH